MQESINRSVDILHTLEMHMTNVLELQLGQHWTGVLSMQAVCIDKIGQKRTAVYQLDRPGAQVPLLLPTVNAGNQPVEGSSAFSHVQSLSKEKNVPKDVKQKLSSLLAAEFSKKVRAGVHCLHARHGH